MQMPGRTFSGNGIGGLDYRYDFNGKEDDKQNGWHTQDYGFRNYDYRLGRFFSLDIKSGEFPYLTPYSYAANNPIKYSDILGQGPGNPPGPFKVWKSGAWYRTMYLTTEDRKWKKVTNDLTLAALGGPGTILSIAENINTMNTPNYNWGDEQAEAAVHSFRDMSIEGNKWLWDLLEFKSFAKFLGKASNVFTAYDVYSEISSHATREERLIELTVFIAQAELVAQIEPSTEHKYLRIPESQFESAEEAQKRLNQIYSVLDQMFSGFDLSDPEEFSVAENIIYNMPGWSFTNMFYFNPSIFNLGGSGSGANPQNNSQSGVCESCGHSVRNIHPSIFSRRDNGGSFKSK